MTCGETLRITFPVLLGVTKYRKRIGSRNTSDYFLHANRFIYLIVASFAELRSI